MRRAGLLVCALAVCAGTPSYFADVANSCLRMRGGVQLGALDTVPIARLEQQVKRVMGADPSLPLNVSGVLDMAEPDLLRVLLLAVLGNFTTAAASGWQQPCALEVDPLAGSFVRRADDGLEGTALRVVVILLMLVEFGRWAQASLREAEAEAALEGKDL
jgi:hypothetical protein